MSLPTLLANNYLPPGIHQATLTEVTARFGVATPRRQALMNRLLELLAVARATGKLCRVFLWGSFVTGKPFPGDLDVFLLMKAGFDAEFTNLPPSRKLSLITDEHNWFSTQMFSGRRRRLVKKSCVHSSAFTNSLAIW